jgi:hypothetical protein
MCGACSMHGVDKHIQRTVVTKPKEKTIHHLEYIDVNGTTVLK